MLETTTWEDVFYIENLNNGTYSYRGKSDKKWYNVCLRPNTVYRDCRFYCVACGSDINKLLRCVAKHISLYSNIYEYYESLQNLSDSGRIGKTSLEQMEEHWKKYGNTKVITQYDKYIAKAIKLGRQTKMYYGKNVKVSYNETKDDYTIDGWQKEWFEDFLDTVMSFDGKTKQEFYELLSDDVDIECMNEIFSGLKHIKCKGIKDMKELSIYRWFDVLVPLVNEWTFSYDQDETDSEQE